MYINRFSFGCFHGENSALAIVQLPIVPEEIELPKIAMQIFAADIVIDADETAPDKRSDTGNQGRAS